MAALDCGNFVFDGFLTVNCYPKKHSSNGDSSSLKLQGDFL